MLKFSKEQLNAPYDQDMDLMVTSVVNWISGNFPEAPLEYTLEHLGLMARAAVLHAYSFEIRSQPQVCAFASLMWLYGPNFDEVPKMSKILRSEMTEEAKIEALYTKVPDQLWQRAHSQRDETRWISLLEAEGADVEDV